MTPSSVSFLYPAQRAPSSLGIEANMAFVSWKELKRTLLYCTSWHGTNDLKALSWQGSLAAGCQLSPSRAASPRSPADLGQAVAGWELLSRKEKNNIRTTGRHMKAFIVSMTRGLHDNFCHSVQKSEDTVAAHFLHASLRNTAMLTARNMATPH